MNAETPGALYTLFGRYFRAKDIPGLLSLYEPGAKWIKQDGSVMETPAEIASALQELLDLGGTFVGEPPVVVAVGELALAQGGWSFEGSDGQVLLSSVSCDLLRQQPDGSWLLVLDNPWGGGRA